MRIKKKFHLHIRNIIILNKILAIDFEKKNLISSLILLTILYFVKIINTLIVPISVTDRKFIQLFF